MNMAWPLPTPTHTEEVYLQALLGRTEGRTDVTERSTGGTSLRSSS